MIQSRTFNFVEHQGPVAIGISSAVYGKDLLNPIRCSALINNRTTYVTQIRLNYIQRKVISSVSSMKWIKRTDLRSILNNALNWKRGELGYFSWSSWKMFNIQLKSNKNINIEICSKPFWTYEMMEQCWLFVCVWFSMFIVNIFDMYMYTYIYNKLLTLLMFILFTIWQRRWIKCCTMKS